MDISGKSSVNSDSLRILFADDEQSLRMIMSIELPRMGHRVTVCEDGASAVAEMERTDFDCILVDLDMPGMGGIEVIENAKDKCPNAQCVILTGKSTVESAIAAVRLAAFDYLTKPCRLKELEVVFRRVIEKRELTRLLRALQRRINNIEGMAKIRGSKLSDLRSKIALVAPTDSSILVLGETGTGKELVARCLHENSLRAEKPFLAINAATLPENLVESELFGHKRGAFSGADCDREGLLEAATGGTLFLDEIGELTPLVQAKLLRALESRQCRRVGENKNRDFDVRLITATHRNLHAMIEEGTFRADLFYRISTLELSIMPLRNRKTDIADLAVHLIERLGYPYNEDEPFSWEALNLLCEYRWPGNVRELANAIEHGIIMSKGARIEVEHLPDKLASGVSKVQSKIVEAVAWLEEHMDQLNSDRTESVRRIREATRRPNGKYRLQKNQQRKAAIVGQAIYQLIRAEGGQLTEDQVRDGCLTLSREIGLRSERSVRNWLGFYMDEYSRA